MNTFLKFFKGGLTLKIGFCFLLISFLTKNTFAQNNSGQINGTVLDNAYQPLPGVAVRLSGKIQTDYITGIDGRFSFNHLYPGNYNLSFETEGFKSFTKQIKVPGQNTGLKISLQASINQLAAVEVTAQKSPSKNTLTSSELDSKEMMQAQGKSLGQMLEQIPGVSAMQSGPTLSKPAIHGLTGNRVLIMNNGVRQEGQQWGDDHAPELDPNTAGSITVVKGAASVRYGSDAIAGVVLMNPLPLPQTPGINGYLGVTGASNGREGSIDGDLEGAFGKQQTGLFSWRAQGTLKRAGNFRTPNYFLDNTGMKEGDFSAQLGYTRKSLNLNASYSEYNSKIGIFSGSEVDNDSELEQAYIHRDHPLTPDSFTYHIGRGRQQINHDILKLGAGYTFSNEGKLKFTYAFQRDLRQEFSPEIQYGPDSTILNLPDDWFKLLTNTVDLIYTEPTKNGFSGSLGFSGKTEDNQYQGLSARPLIPNYTDYGGGVFGIEKFTKGKWLLEGGLRYDYLHRKVYAFESGSVDNVPDQFQYKNLTGTVGATFSASKHLSLNANFGMGWRPPGAEEMFIYGVHSSAAQFAIGDSSLKIERSYNTTFSVNYHSDKFRLDADLYDNEINHFIYLTPIGVMQIGGSAYHAFQYVQDNVQLLGTDISAQWDFLPNLEWSSKVSLLRATNKTRDGGLINMPPAKFVNGLTFHLKGWQKVTQPYLTLQNVSVLKQNYIVAAQEILLPPPPPAYSLWNINVGCDVTVGKNILNLDFAVNNLTNKVYSDYMNQFRYFAYNTGINFALRAKISF